MRPYQPYNPSAVSTSNELVPTQNNLVQDYEWYFLCNQQHNHSTCTNGVIFQALMVQSIPNSQDSGSNEATLQQHEGRPPETTLLNW